MTKVQSMTVFIFMSIVANAFIPIAKPASPFVASSGEQMRSKQVKDELSIVAVGDITVGMQLTPIIEKDGPDVLFTEIDQIFKEADLALGFLECAISDVGEKRQGVETGFHAPTELARALASSGFDILSLATPHTLDYGAEGLEETIRLLKWYGVNPIGAGSDLKSAREPVISTIHGSKIAFLAYYQGSLFSDIYAGDLPPKGRPGVAPADYRLMKNDVVKVSQKVDRVVVLLHWGKQTSDQVTDRQKYFTHGLIDSGADIVFCQKLHTFQGIELYRSKPIIYSLADLIFERYDKRYSRIVIPKIIFRDGELTKITLIPIQTDADTNYQPKLLHGDSARNTLETYRSLCDQLGTNLEIEDEKGIIEFGK